MTLIDIEDLMSRLATSRAVFHSEADFQHELAILMRLLRPDLRVRLEVPVMPRTVVDMLVTEPSSGERIAIELKYKTAHWEGIVEGEAFRLKNHGADDLGSYDVLKDVSRIEVLIRERLVTQGMVVFVTNEPLYWKTRASGTRRTNAHEFRIHENVAPLTGVRSWGPKTGGSSRNREAPIALAGNYSISWAPYSNVGNGRGEFRCLVFHVASPATLGGS